MDARYVREFECGDRTIKVLVKRSRRRTMAIHVFHDRAPELRVPLNCPWRDIEEFLDARIDWIAESLDSLAVVDIPEPPSYVEGETHHYLGEPLHLRCVSGRTKNVSIVGDMLSVRCTTPDDPERIQAILEEFYRTEAKRLMPERVAMWRQRFNVDLPEPDISVRKMRARWGSCSSKGEICLNSLLMQKPLAAIDFVVTHELCHLKHFAHNKSFYRLMDRVMPDWRERERLLLGGNVTLQLDLF